LAGACFCLLAMVWLGGGMRGRRCCGGFGASVVGVGLWWCLLAGGLWVGLGGVVVFGFGMELCGVWFIGSFGPDGLG
jgi:hypothetical protein